MMIVICRVDLRGGVCVAQQIQEHGGLHEQGAFHVLPDHHDYSSQPDDREGGAATSGEPAEICARRRAADCAANSAYPLSEGYGT